jgi:hypothetical protein
MAGALRCRRFLRTRTTDTGEPFQMRAGSAGTLKQMLPVILDLSEAWSRVDFEVVSRLRRAASV